MNVVPEDRVSPGHDRDLTPLRVAESLVSNLWEDQETFEWCREHCERLRDARKRELRELPRDVDPNDLSQTGWGIIMARGTDPKVYDALQPLIKRRRHQAGSHRFKKLDFRHGETVRNFLWYRHGISPGVLDTKKWPYYLLIVGDPETIPFGFQYQLSVNCAVGRIHFENPDDYRRYAESVLKAEDDGAPRPRRATFFAVEEDTTTAQMKELMVKPLLERLPRPPDWELDLWDGDRSTKAAIGRLLAGDEQTPALLLASCHGKRLPCGDPDQEARQGALVCRGGQADRHFHAEDLREDARLDGLIAFLLGCYSAGTPELDSYPHERKAGTAVGARPAAIAKRSFLARLPQKLLRQGALAVVGQVDRGWTLSFNWTPYGANVDAVRSLEDALRELLRGRRLGDAMRPLARRYTAIAAQLAEPLELVRKGEMPPTALLGFLWTAHNDARNLIILGDPAVQILGNGSGPGDVWGRIKRGSKGRDAIPVYLPEDILTKAREMARLQGLGVDQWIRQMITKTGRCDEGGEQ